MSAITDRRVAAVVGALVADAAGIASYFKVKPKRNFEIILITLNAFKVRQRIIH